MKKPLLFFALLSTMLPILLNAQADYGDAPDGMNWGIVPATFISLDANMGPRHTAGNLSTYWIGESANNSTTLEQDALLIDEDQDDGQPFIFVWLISQPAPAQATIPISTSTSHDPTLPIYINMAMDVDQDMDYNTDHLISDNWVIKNYPLLVPADTTIYFDSPIFMFGNDPWLFPLWGRVTLTSVPVSPFLHWDGSGPPGGWTDGETEDWFFDFGRNPGEYGGSSGSNWGKNGGGKGNKRTKKPPVKPKSGKFAVMKYPRVVYVKCNQTKCFPVTVENRGGLPISNIRIDFTHLEGTPLPGGVTIKPGTPNPATTILNPSPPNRKQTFTFCCTGWPCTTPEEDRWAKYRIRLNYDPEGIISFQEFELFLKDGEIPIWQEVGGFTHFDVAAGTSTPEDMGPWIGKVNQAMSRQLDVWSGRYPGGVARWITSQPDLVPIYMPHWMSITGQPMGPDSMRFTYAGTPGPMDNGMDSIVLMVTATDTIVDNAVTPWLFKIPIFIEFDNQKPIIRQTFPDTLLISTDAGDQISQHIIVEDPDIAANLDDFLFVDFYLWDIAGDSLYTPQNFPDFEDSTMGRASFSWQPDMTDHGTYKLVTLGWDYYGAVDTFTTFLDISPVNSIGSDMLAHFWLKAYPNPAKENLLIQFEIPKAGDVQFELLDLSGRRIWVMDKGMMQPGIHKLEMNSSDMAAGAYLLRMRAGEHFVRQKLLKM